MRKAALLAGVFAVGFAVGYAVHIGVEYGLRALLLRVSRRNSVLRLSGSTQQYPG
jgi:hypothetical protein